MALVNDAHLKEARDMLSVLESLEGIPLSSWMIRSVQSWFRAHYLWTSRRFQVNRSYVVPLWEERFHYPHVVVEAQDEFERDLHAIARIVDGLQEECCVDGDEAGLHEAWHLYVLHLEAAMVVFTDVGVALYHAYFSYEEHLELMKGLDVVQKISRHTQGLGATIDACGGIAAFQSVCLGEEGVHFELEGFYRKRYLDYTEHVKIHMIALSTGGDFDKVRNLIKYSAHVRNVDVHIMYALALGGREEVCGLTRQENSCSLSQELVPFNPLDPKYRKNEQFAPNKLGEWKTRSPLHVEESAWVLVNCAQRAEVREMKEVLQSVAARGEIPAWTVESIKQWWASHREWVETRLDVLRDHTLPALERRLTFPASLVEALEGMRIHIHTVGELVDQLQPGDQVWRLYDLFDAWSAYEALTVESLNLCEPMAIMLFHAYFNQDEVAQIVRMEHQKMSSLCTGAVVYHVGREKAAGAIPLNALQLNFRLTEYKNASVVHLRALQSGKKTLHGRRGSVENFCLMLKDSLKDEELQPFEPEESPPKRSPSVGKSLYSLLNSSLMDEMLPSIASEEETLAKQRRRSSGLTDCSESDEIPLWIYD
uniref:Uncharacterized protein n=1 Tax=Odontella aurita TaxID=265563 RepID=A0A7S4J2C9_9STRA